MRASILLILLIFPLLACAQKTEKFKFKKVSKTLLEQTEHPLYADAIAAFDQNRCRIWYEYLPGEGFVAIIETIHRIKIYKEEGKEYGNIELSLYNNVKDEEEIIKMDAMTFNMVNDKVEKTSVSKSDIFTNRVNDNYVTYSVALPNVQIGSVLEIKYQMRTPFYFYLDPFYLQKSVPVNNMSYEADFPEYFSYNPIIKGGINMKEEKSTKQRSLRLDNNESENYLSQDWKFEGQNISPVKDEKYVHNMKNYMSSISWELRSTNFPGSFVKNYNTSWNQVAKQLNERESFGKYIRANNKEIKEVLASFEGLDDKEKIKAIYEHVSLNYKWNERHSALGGKLRTFVKEKTGNSGQINLLMVNMLQKSGIEAFPIVLKTRGNGYMNATFASLSELNYVIAGVQTEKGILFLDGTIPYLPMGSLPSKAINLHGVIIKGNVAEKINISSPNQDKYTHLLKLKLTEDGQLVGERSSAYFKYSSFEERVKIRLADSKDEYFASQHEENNKISYSELNVENVESFSKPIKVSAKVDYSGYVQKIDGKIFIPTLLDLGITENPFREGERNYNLTFNTTHSSKIILNIEIPEGYVVESIPETISLALPEKKLVYRFKTVVMDNTINITSFTDRKTDNINYDLYSSLREIYSEILNRSTEQIVLARE